MLFVKIALRNILKNKRRTILTGLPVFVSFSLLLLSSSIGNGIKNQIILQYKNFQSGDVAVIWKNAKDLSKDDPSRVFFSKFDIHNNDENKKAISKFEEFLKTHKDKIKAVYKPIKSSGTIDNNKFVSYITIYGIDKEELNFLLRNKIIQLQIGYYLYDYTDSVYISNKTALENNIKIGDVITVDGKTPYGLVNSKEFRVVGIYEIYSDYDSFYVYMPRDNALDLFECEEEYFSMARVYLKNPKKSFPFAKELDDYLDENNRVLYSEAMNETTDFYFKIAQLQKSVFIFFIIFILFLVAIALRATISLRIFQQLKEFGTIRAIGFSGFQNFIIIFFEILFLSLFSFLFSVFFVCLIILILNITGIYIGRGAYSYLIGSTYIYPSLNFFDFIAALFILLGFSLFSILTPALKCSFQNITDLLNRKFKNISLMYIVFYNKRRHYL